MDFGDQIGIKVAIPNWNAKTLGTWKAKSGYTAWSFPLVPRSFVLELVTTSAWLGSFFFLVWRLNKTLPCSLALVPQETWRTLVIWVDGNPYWGPCWDEQETWVRVYWPQPPGKTIIENLDPLLNYGAYFCWRGLWRGMWKHFFTDAKIPYFCPVRFSIFPWQQGFASEVSFRFIALLTNLGVTDCTKREQEK